MQSSCRHLHSFTSSLSAQQKPQERVFSCSWVIPAHAHDTHSLCQRLAIAASDTKKTCTHHLLSPDQNRSRGLTMLVLPPADNPPRSAQKRASMSEPATYGFRISLDFWGHRGLVVQTASASETAHSIVCPQDTCVHAAGTDRHGSLSQLPLTNTRLLTPNRNVSHAALTMVSPRLVAA
jgi:hypothetical protein